MEINSTLFVQLINFIIAYLILRIFLFKPIVAVVAQETNERESLIALVEARTVIVQQKETERRQRWLEHQEEFASIIPVITRPELFVFKEIEPQLTLQPIEQKTIDRTVSQITEDIVNKAKHGIV